MAGALIVTLALLVAAFLAFSRKLSRSASWAATVTPLASIMGSGFLVSAPLLAGVVGNLALLCMAGLLAIAYGVGGVIRFNIRYFEPIENAGEGPAQVLSFISRLVLAAAYFISVSYYLQLLASFVLSAAGTHDLVLARILSSALLLVIGGVGILRGLGLLEKVERYAVSLNLGVIAALLVALLFYNAQLALGGQWALPDISSDIDFGDVRVLLGLLIVVQGFETSRYLGDEHPAELRIATMRRAQLLSTAIYLVFVGLATVLFRSGGGADVTAIMGMVKPVAAVLPLLIVVAAVGSQFSAAVADNSGAGGLIEDITNRRVPIRYAYLLILVLTLLLTWETNVTQIIAYASRAFAFYYMLQALVAFAVAWQRRDLARRLPRLVGFAALALICLAVFALGLPAE